MTATPRQPALDRLIADLRAQKLPVSAHEAIDAARLLERLAHGSDAGEHDLTALKPALRCVLCKTAADTAIFDRVYAIWQRASQEPGKTAGTTAIPDALISDQRWEALGFVALIVAAIALVAVYFPGAFLGGIDRGTGPVVSVPDTPAASPVPEQVPPPARDSSSPPSAAPRQYFVALRSNQEIRPLWLTTLLLLPLAAIALSLLRAMPQLWLSRWRGGGDLHLDAWPQSKYADMLVAPLRPAIESGLSRHIAGPVEQRHRYARQPMLDLRRTIETTLSQHSLPRLRYRFGRLHPCYLVLVHASSDDDYGMLWARRLRAHGLKIDLFRVQSSPGQPVPDCIEIDGESRRLRFDQLPTPEPGQRLIIVSAVGFLFHPFSAAEHTWVREAHLQRWPHRVLFTAEETRDWNKTQVETLERQRGADRGMLVLPLDDNAVAAWAELLQRDRLPQIQLSERERFPRLLREDERRFVNDGEADCDTGLKLVAELQHYLGQNGFYWLCACAVPPVIERKLALLLGEEYFKRCNALPERISHYMASNWRLLARLPWLREEDDDSGSTLQIPQWLRLLLLARLPSAVQYELRDVVRNALKLRHEPDAGAASIEVRGVGSIDREAGETKISSGKVSLFVGFVQDELSAEQLLLRLPGHWNNWLPALVRPPSWRQRWRAARARRQWRDGIPSSGTSQRWYVSAFAAAALIVVGIGWLVSHQPQDLAPDTRTLFYHEAVHRLYATIEQPVDSLAFGDRRMVTASGATLRLWDTSLAVPVGKPIEAPGVVAHVALSRDDRLIAAARSSGDVFVINADSGQPLRHVRVSPDVVAIAFGQGSNLVTLSSSGLLETWDWERNTRSADPRQCEAGVAGSISDNGEHVAFIAADDAVYICVPNPRIAIVAPVATTAIAANGQVALISGDGTVQLVDSTANEASPAVLRRLDHTGVRQAAFSADGQRLVTASATELRFWTSAEDASARSYGANVSLARASADGERIALVQPNGVDVVRAADGVVEATLPPAAVGSTVRDALPTRLINGAEFSPDGTQLALVRGDGQFVLWRIGTRGVSQPPELESVNTKVLRVSPDGRLVFAGLPRGGGIFHLDGSKPAVQFALEAPVQSAEFSPDSRQLVVINSVRFYIVDTATGVVEVGPSSSGSLTGRVQRAAINAGNTRVLTVGSRGVTLWDATSIGRTGDTPSSPLMRWDAGIGASFSPDGKDIVVVHAATPAAGSPTDASLVRIYAATDGAPKASVAVDGLGVRDAAFSPDGRMLATNGSALQVWETATGRLLGMPLRPSRRLQEVRWSTDGTSLLATLESNGTGAGPALRVSAPESAVASTGWSAGWLSVLRAIPNLELVLILAALLLALFSARQSELRLRQPRPARGMTA